MDGRIDGWMEGWMDGWMVDPSIDRCLLNGSIWPASKIKRLYLFIIIPQQKQGIRHSRAGYSLFSHRTFGHFHLRHSLCSKQDIPVPHAGHSVLCSTQDIPCVQRRTFLVFEAGHSVCSTQDIPCAPRRTFRVLNQ